MRLKIRDTNTLIVKIETCQRESGVWIEVQTDHKIAIAVDTRNGERIYLPDVEGDDSTYYTENMSGLVKTSEGYGVLHQDSIEDIKVLG
jgi:hypothetical protein